jgi:hypothetical protein
MRHPPQPRPSAVQEPRGLVHGGHRSRPSHFTHGHRMREERVRDALDQLRDGPWAHWSPQERGAQVLPGTAACAHEACPLTDAAGQPWAIAAALGGRHGRVAGFAACPALGAGASASRRVACMAAPYPDGCATASAPHAPAGHRHLPRARALQWPSVPTGPGDGRHDHVGLPASVARRLACIGGAWSQAPRWPVAGGRWRRAGSSALPELPGV